MFQTLFALPLVVGLVAAGQKPRPARQLPPSTDTDPQLTGEFRRLEQELGDAILHKDADALEHLVGPDDVLRIADRPQTSMPRAVWMQNSLGARALKPESFEVRECAARKLADDLTAVSLIFDQKGPSKVGTSLVCSISWIPCAST